MAGSPETADGKTAELIDKLALEVRRTIEHADANQVHDLRVSARRFCQILAVLDGSDELSGIAKIRRKVKKKIELAGTVRDLDIAAKLVAKEGGSAAVQARIRRRRRAAERELVTALGRWVSRGFEEKWRAKLDHRHASLRSAERKTLAGAARRLFARAKDTRAKDTRAKDTRAKDTGSAAALHKLRIAAKRLRYTMELLSFGAATIEQIKQLQSRLGAINDYETARRLIATEGAPQRLLARLEEAQEKKTRQFRRYWKREFAGKEKEWLAILTHPRAHSHAPGPPPRQHANSQRNG
jgi:CHAD domain-containing protein